MKRKERIEFRVTPEEKTRIEALAKSRGRSLAGYCRWRALEARQRASDNKEQGS